MIGKCFQGVFQTKSHCTRTIDEHARLAATWSKQFGSGEQIPCKKLLLCSGSVVYLVLVVQLLQKLPENFNQSEGRAKQVQPLSSSWMHMFGLFANGRQKMSHETSFFELSTHPDPMLLVSLTSSTWRRTMAVRCRWSYKSLRLVGGSS